MNGLIILLCRNALPLSKACLQTLLAQTVPVDILAVDNASSDGTTRYLQTQQHVHSNLYRMTFPVVESVAHCWNQALLWGWSRGHERALVVNSDTELLPGTYEQLETYMQWHDAGMVTAVGVAKDPTYPRDICWRDHPDYSCYMVTRWAHLRVPFDEGYEGAYFEDADHHVRMYRNRIRAGSINLGFLHHSSGTLKNADPAEAERIHRNYAANKARFYATYGCVPGTKAYEQLFLPVGGANNNVPNPSQLQQEQAK